MELRRRPCDDVVAGRGEDGGEPVRRTDVAVPADMHHTDRCHAADLSERMRHHSAGMHALEPLDELFLDPGRRRDRRPHRCAAALRRCGRVGARSRSNDLRELIDGHLERLPVLRRRLEPDPSRPGRHRWTEDEAVDLAAHVHGHRLAGGDDRALGRLAAELNAPAAGPLAAALGDARDRRAARRPCRRPPEVPSRSGRRHARAVWWSTRCSPSVKRTPSPSARAPVRNRRQAPDANATPAGPPPTAPATRFNRPLSGERDFAFAPFGRARVERIRSASATTFTDVLLAAWAGALRGWLALRGETPAVPLVARVPMSLRRPDDDARQRQSPGGRWRLPAPADQGDARARLRERARGDDAGQADPGFRRRGSPPAPGSTSRSRRYVGSSRQLAWGGAAGVGIYSLAMVNVSGLSIACVTNADGRCGSACTSMPSRSPTRGRCCGRSISRSPTSRPSRGLASADARPGASRRALPQPGRGRDRRPQRCADCSSTPRARRASSPSNISGS